MLRMSMSIKLLSRIFKILDFFNNPKKIFSKSFGKIFELQKVRIYMKAPCQVYMRTKLQVDMLTNDRVLVF